MLTDAGRWLAGSMRAGGRLRFYRAVTSGECSSPMHSAK